MPDLTKKSRCADCAALDIGLTAKDDFPHCSIRHAVDIAHAGAQGCGTTLQHEITRDEAMQRRDCEHFKKANGTSQLVTEYWNSNPVGAPIVTRKDLADMCRAKQVEMLPELVRQGIVKVSAQAWEKQLFSMSDDEIIACYGRCSRCGYSSPTWMSNVDIVLKRRVRKLDEFWALVEQLDQFWEHCLGHREAKP